MNVRPSILCPIDFSDASAGALRYAAALARHFVTRLVVLTVEDPLLTAAMDLETGVRWTREASEREIAGFAAEIFDRDPTALALCEYDVAIATLQNGWDCRWSRPDEDAGPTSPAGESVVCGRTGVQRRVSGTPATAAVHIPAIGG